MVITTTIGVLVGVVGSWWWLFFIWDCDDACIATTYGHVDMHAREVETPKANIALPNAIVIRHRSSCLHAVVLHQIVPMHSWREEGSQTRPQADR